MLQSVVTQRDLRNLKGKVLNDFSYSVTYKNFVKSATVSPKFAIFALDKKANG